MAFTTPPTFTSGNVLTAAQLNTLSGDVEYLYSITHGINIGFTGQTTSTAGNTRPYSLRRRVQYLHYKIRVTSGTVDSLSINVNGNNEFTDGVNRSSGYTYSGYIDLTAITAVPTVKDFYTIYSTVAFDPSGEITIDYYIESNSTTL